MSKLKPFIKDQTAKLKRIQRLQQEHKSRCVLNQYFAEFRRNGCHCGWRPWQTSNCGNRGFSCDEQYCCACDSREFDDNFWMTYKSGVPSESLCKLNELMAEDDEPIDTEPNFPHIKHPSVYRRYPMGLLCNRCDSLGTIEVYLSDDRFYEIKDCDCYAKEREEWFRVNKLKATAYSQKP